MYNQVHLYNVCARHSHVCAYVCVNMHVCVCVCVCARMRMFGLARLACAHVHAVYVCMHKCMYTCIPRTHIHS